MNSHHIYDYIFQARAVESPARQTEIGPYQVPPPPRPVLFKKPSSKDNININNNSSSNNNNNKTETSKNNNKNFSDPYGTFRASKSLVKISSGRKIENLSQDLDDHYSSGDDDVFHRDYFKTQNNNNNKSDPFGTLKAANRVSNRPQPSPTATRDKKMDDYRSTTLPKCRNQTQEFNSGNNGNQLTRDEVGLADELLKILDDFQKKSFSAKEMEDAFENWRKKADINSPEFTGLEPKVN